MKIEIVINKEKHLESVVVDGNKVFDAANGKSCSLELYASAFNGAEQVYKCCLECWEHFNP